MHLERDELELLRDACSFDWKLVEPSIFGNLLEGALGRERVWAFGAHYTAEADIRKVVEPTIVEPWRERIEACASLAELEERQREFGEYKILDPACGSGNFLYVAYRDLRRLEVRLRARERELRAEAGLAPESHTPAYPLSNVFGLEVEPFAVKLARVTLWMAHKLAVEELSLDEPVLPLGDLSGIRRADALKVEWPPANAIIGNPPYIGTKLMRSRLGDDYVDWLDREFRVGVKDYAVYWFRKAHDNLPSGGRAGLVATNSIREGRNREASLEYIAQNAGVITEAISSEPWSGEANVHVSIVNWVKRPATLPSSFVLDGSYVDGITTTLRPGLASTVGRTLSANLGRQFFGVVPGGDGFLLSPEEANDLLGRSEAAYEEVIRPYLVGSDVTNNPTQAPSRYIIDFHFNALEDAMRYPAALARVRSLVKPHRDRAKRKAYRERWWRLEEPIVAMRNALDGLSRYIACPAQAKRFYMVWCQPEWVPSNLTSVFALDDDYSMGVLTSAIHTRWATAQSTTLETRPRYTTASFATFPWPLPSDDQCSAIGELSRSILARRSEICLDRGIGLTKLYNEVDEGAYRDLRDLHTALDEAVAAAYGWPKSAAHDPTESNRRLLDLNEAITAGRIDYSPF
ncbi:MAG: DNA methyltransferase [Gaiellaceae bacterium]